ncbi:MAG TPA: hypothetical protein DCY31_02585, partial [Ruminococcaceae bacterium]|nr:hypothetical protein [Oscillospiraceae bacterium]
MAKSRRILSALLSVLMVLTIVPAGLFSTAGAVSDNEISTTSIELNRSFLERPNISISSTAVIRTAAAANSQAAGTTIVKATASGLPELTGSTAEGFYAGETPQDPMVVFTTDKALKANPTITCSNAALTFTPASAGAYADGVYTYSWKVSGANVTAKQLNFEVGYTYEYTDVNGKVVTNTYTAYTTSAVENVAQPGGISAYRYRSYHFFDHNCDRKEKVSYIARIVGANTFGTFVDNTQSGWSRGYWDFNTGSFTTVDGVASGYGQVRYDDHSNDGTQTANTANDFNRPVTTAYVDRSIVALSNYNLRFTITDFLNRTDDYSNYGIKEFKIVPGAVAFDENTPDNNSANEQLVPVKPANYNESTKEYDTVAGGTITIPFTGTTYEKNATTLDNGNKSVDYTIIVSFGDEYKHISRIRSAVNLNIVTYDKSNLRTHLQDLYRLYTPTKLMASESEIGNSPNEWFYSEGWDQYLAAMKNAQFVLNDPDTDQQKIDAADAALQAAVKALKVATADYTEANVVKDEVKALNASLYTDESWSRVQTAVANITDGISVFCQAYLDSLVADLRKAISLLEMNPADYTNVNTMIEIYEGLTPEHYTAESWAVLRDTVNSVDWNLKVDKQGLVDAFATSIDSAINNLVLAPADYTEVDKQVERYNNALPNKDLYTDLSWRAAQAAYNAIERDKNWKQQDEVDDMATNLKSAIDRLKYKDADYSALEAAIDAASSEVESWYTPETWAPFAEALAAAEEAYEAYDSGSPLDINHQSEIDAIKDALVTAQKGLIIADGDYTKVYEAIDSTNDLDESKYTADSWQALQDAIDSVVYNLNAKEQERIDGFADAINTAIKNLKEKGADYTEVNAIIKEWNEMDKSLYTEASILNVANTVNAVDWNLPVSKQAVVDGYVVSIRAAINALEYKPADYTKVNAAEAKAKEAIQLQKDFAAAHNGYLYYTKETMDALEATLNYTKGLDIRYQTTVDGYADAINNAIAKIQLNNADYSAVEAARKKIPADFDNDVYTDETAAEVIAANLAVTEGLLTKDQDTVDGYARDLEAAIAGLKYKPADYTRVEAEKALIPTDLTPYTKSSVENLQNVLASVDYDLDINHQSEVDGYADAIKAAREALELDLADYTKVNEAKAKAEEAIKDTNYTDESIQAVKDAIAKIVEKLPKSEQARVDGFATAIDDAVAHLTDKPLDLTSYNKAIARVPSNLGNYTDASVKLYTDALAAADSYKLTKNSIRNQTEFEALVSALDAAITGLKLKGADYTKVNEAKTIADAKAESGDYTADSVARYNDLIATINWNLSIEDQKTVDGYADAINAFVFEYIGADYTALTAAIAEREAEIEQGSYTVESVADFRSLIGSFNMDLKKPRQPEVDDYVEQVKNYKFTYKSADYTDLDALIEKVNALDSSLYTNYDEIYDSYIFDYVFGYIPAHRDYNITEQDKVKEMQDTLQSYIDMLILKDQKVARFDLINGAKVKSSGGVKYIIGLKTSLTDDAFKKTYTSSENVTIKITKATTGRVI